MDDKARSRRRITLGVVALAFGLVAAVAAGRALPLAEIAGRLVGAARDAGPAGALLYAAAYVAATVLFVPGLVLTLGGGFLYGPLWGTLLISPASVAGATAAFLLGRTLLRDRVARRFAGDARFRAIDRAVAENGFRTVLLLRLSPLFPFNVLNYALGLTSVTLRDYVLGSFLGMLPATAVYVWIGSLASSTAELFSGEARAGGGARLALLVAGVAATLVVVALVARRARRELRRHLDAQVAPP